MKLLWCPRLEGAQVELHLDPFRIFQAALAGRSRCWIYCPDLISAEPERFGPQNSLDWAVNHRVARLWRSWSSTQMTTIETDWNHQFNSHALGLFWASFEHGRSPVPCCGQARWAFKKVQKMCLFCLSSPRNWRNFCRSTMVVSAIFHPMETPVFPSTNPIDPGDFANMPFRQPLTYMVVLVVRAPGGSPGML